MSILRPNGCTKIAYPTERDARAAAKVLRRHKGMRKRMRPYQCPGCDVWHLTKNAERGATYRLVDPATLTGGAP